LRKEHRLRVFGNRVLRKIFGPKRDELAEDWKRLLNVAFYTSYSLPNLVVKSRRIRLTRASRDWRREEVHTGLEYLRE
jgi:hypothetical protein